MTTNDERPERALTADSIDQLRDALDGVERLSDDALDVFEASVTVGLSERDAERLDALMDALGADVDVSEPETPSTPAPTPTTADGGVKPVTPADTPETPGSNRGPSEYPIPGVGETQEPPGQDRPLPEPGSIVYAVLATAYALAGDGGWTTTREVADSEWTAYDFSQVQGGMSRLFRKRGALRRRRPVDDPSDNGPTLEYQLTDEAIEHVRDNGRYPWPEDVEPPSDPKPLGDRPYVLPDEAGHPDAA